MLFMLRNLLYRIICISFAFSHHLHNFSMRDTETRVSICWIFLKVSANKDDFWSKKPQKTQVSVKRLGETLLKHFSSPLLPFTGSSPHAKQSSGLHEYSAAPTLWWCSKTWYPLTTAWPRSVCLWRSSPSPQMWASTEHTFPVTGEENRKKTIKITWYVLFTDISVFAYIFAYMQTYILQNNHCRKTYKWFFNLIIVILFFLLHKEALKLDFLKELILLVIVIITNSRRRSNNQV